MASTSADLADLLLDADDAWLADLLQHRGDLARPVPQSITALATRAGTRASAARALAGLTAPELATLEAVVVLSDGRGHTRTTDVEAGLGTDPAAWLNRLRALALVIGPDDALQPTAGVAEAVGPTALGLGPTLRTLGVRQDEGWPTTAPALRTRLADAPDAARRLLDALTWGPAVGTLGTTVPPAARWLLDHHVLHRSAPTEVVLPREVALAARGNRLVRDLAAAPQLPDVAEREASVVAAEAVTASDTVLRHLEALVARWRDTPPSVLRAGGLSARDAKAVAVALGVEVGDAVLVCELAAMVGLVGHVQHDEGAMWAPTTAAQAAAELPDEERWAQLAAAWLRSARVPWLAGTRTERGVLRAALDPDLHRNWAAALRRRILEALAAWPEGAAPSAEQVRAHLAWQAPRSVPPTSTVAAVLAEATALGLIGAGALAAPARTLLAGGGPTEVASTLVALRPPAVAELIIQSDLTGIVPGRPTVELAALLDASADVDSRGAALTVRFTAASVGRALTAGWPSAELLARLRGFSRSELPQPLEYLVRDAARRHRTVRVQPAAAVVQVDDEAGLLALLGDPRLAHLGLRQVGPTTLAADAGAMSVHEALRTAGAAPVLEGSDGRPVALASKRPRAARPVGLEGPPTESGVAPDRAVATMRAGEERAAALLAGTAAAPTPTDDLDMLRAAASRGTQVRIVVAGSGGTLQERVVRPLSVDGGRVRALDTSREAEITVASHRIVAVRPL